METAARIRQYIVQNFYVADAALGDDDSLLERGVIDSTGVLELIAYLEDEFGIRVAETEMLPDNLDSISRISAYVHRKRA